MINALWQATTGVMVKHACRLARTLKSASEASVRRINRLRADLAARSGLSATNELVPRITPRCRRLISSRRRSVLPGVQLTTCHAKGSASEHGNLKPSADVDRHAAKPGDVSAEGRSLRSSQSAGEPRTRRREAGDESDGSVAGESGVRRVRALPDSRASGPFDRAPATSRQHLSRARCVSKGARRVR